MARSAEGWFPVSGLPPEEHARASEVRIERRRNMRPLSANSRRAFNCDGGDADEVPICQSVVAKQYSGTAVQQYESALLGFVQDRAELANDPGVSRHRPDRAQVSVGTNRYG